MPKLKDFPNEWIVRATVFTPNVPEHGRTEVGVDLVVHPDLGSFVRDILLFPMTDEEKEDMKALHGKIRARLKR